jgi:aerobic carbon-monoxide dehydrogenase small subunit
MTMTSMQRPTRALYELAMTVNGRPVELAIEPRETLIEVLRERLGLYGTKKSCDVQVCGACTVLVDGLAVSSCTFLAIEARGKEVLSIEGLADGEEFHPIQNAFIEHGALQCGFCTPGMILSVKALLDDIPAPSEAEIKHYLRGNICRCTGYKKILEAVVDAAERLQTERPG